MCLAADRSTAGCLSVLQAAASSHAPSRRARLAAAKMAGCDEPWFSRLALTLLLLCSCCPTTNAWPWSNNEVTFVLPAKLSSPGSVPNTISLDCSHSGGAITIIDATYGIPCSPSEPPCQPTGTAGCAASCAVVKKGNYIVEMEAECKGKLKCDVSTCLCPKSPATCPHLPSWPITTGCAQEDPAPGYGKGATVTYRCGSSTWGLSFLVLCSFGTVAYVGAGLAYSIKVQRRQPEARGLKGVLMLHPHERFWLALAGLVRDGAGFTQEKLGWGGAMAKTEDGLDAPLTN